MEISFLETEGETFALFMSAVYYVVVMFHIHDKYLKLLKQPKAKEKSNQQKIRKLYLRAFLLFLIGPVIHFILYALFYDVFPLENEEIPKWRNQYLIMIGITFIGFCLASLFNFYRKDATTLPTQDGPVTGV